jgi:hypothetical protein
MFYMFGFLQFVLDFSKVSVFCATLYFATPWWWATSKPETCRGVVTQYTEDKQCIKWVSLHA